MEMAMSNNHLNYLRREHARLDAEIQREERQVRPDEVLIARLKKLKLAVKDQMAAACVDLPDSRFGCGIGGGAEGSAPPLRQATRPASRLFETKAETAITRPPHTGRTTAMLNRM